MRELKAETRFHDTWNDAIAAEKEVLEQRRTERAYRRMLAMTDDVLGGLERRNLAGKRELDEVIRHEIDRMLVNLSPEARQRFPVATTVQEALDGIFVVQEALLLVLQRMLHWDRLLASPWGEPMVGADEPLVRRTA
jgi:hypothetical protein